MLKKTTFLLLFLVSSISIFAQDWVPVITGFSYNASECNLSFSCYVKNIDDDNDAEATAYKIIIFNIADNSEVFNTDVPVDEIKRLSSSPSKNWTIDLPALAGYRPDVSYKIAVVANTNGKFEFDKKNNRVESAQFACGKPALNNASAKPADGGSGNDNKSAGTNPATNAKDLAQTAADMKASRDQMIETNKAAKEQEKQTLTSKVENLKQKVSKRILERDQYEKGTKEWSDLAYEVADLELELKISETELERVTDEIAYGQEGLSKSEKERYKIKLEKLESQQDENKKNQKNGLIFGQTPAENADAKQAPAKDGKNGSSEKESAKSNKKEAEEKEAYKVYSAEEIALLSTFDLKKLKLDYNSEINKGKLTLKTRKAYLSIPEKTAIETKIADLTKQIELIEAELAKRD
jgi:hypothetical protein